MSDDLAARLREQGLRLTPQRELILRAVEELRHATPDEVLAHVRGQVSSVNASTVYRTLEVLEELGLVRHTHLSDRAPTYHSTREHEHVHVVCRGCGSVRSVRPRDRGVARRGAGGGRVLRRRRPPRDLRHLRRLLGCWDLSLWATQARTWRPMFPLVG